MHDDFDEHDDEMDVADQVAYEDTGRPWGWGRHVIKHPSHLPTRRHFETNPLPAQSDRRAS